LFDFPQFLPFFRFPQYHLCLIFPIIPTFAWFSPSDYALHP
jgi:hypothetical protein